MRRTFEVGHGLTCDIDRLVASRLLVQANSGGGKTRTLRRLLEQTHGRVQHLVIDPEGEYHTLREKFDYVLAAPQGGDTVAHPRTAKLLAERLLQLGVSAILDIYELEQDARKEFVKGFISAVVNAPRALWHPALIVLDEAHVYAPEGKDDIGSGAAVKALASRGRKRGFCLIPATQRLAKLSKDVAAECNNKLIGRCTLDVDIKRAGEELGLTQKDATRLLRALEPGQFYGFGPAFDVREPVRVLVGPIVSTHPEPGQQAAPVPPPTAKVKKVLQQLADLPAEAEAREKSIEDLKRDNATLRRQVTEAQKVHPQAPVSALPKVIEKPVITDAQIARVDKLLDRFEKALGLAMGQHVIGMREALQGLVVAVKAVRQPPARPATAKPTGNNNYSKATTKPVTSDGLTAPKQRILNALVWGETMRLPTQRRDKVAFLAGASPKSSAYMNNLGSLCSGGFIAYPQRGHVALTEAGRAIAVVEADAPQTSTDLQDAICRRLSTPQARIVRVAVRAYPAALDRGELAHGAEASPTSSAYMNNLGSLHSLGLLDYPERGRVKASPVLFLEEL